MSQQRVPLHLSKTNAAPKLAPLDGLSRQGVDWASGTYLRHIADRRGQGNNCSRSRAEALGSLWGHK